MKARAGNRTGNPSGRRAGSAPGLDRETLVGIYRMMYLSRRIDDRELQLKRQNKYFFQISGAGHEAILVAAGMALKASHDWFYPYYRDRALCLQLGMTPKEMFMQGVGAAADPNSGSRQMPAHWGHKALNIVSQSSPTGTQFLQAVGCAEAGRYLSQMDEAVARAGSFKGDEIVLVSGGDGSTSEGEFYEAFMTACVWRLPVIFLIEDNGYAISVPVWIQTPGGSISKALASVPNLTIEEVDGCDPLASLEVMRRVVDRMRQREIGPVLVHAQVVRPYSHSQSDDEKAYKTEAERAEEARRDPIARFGAWLVGQGLAAEEFLAEVRADADAEVSRAADEALAEAKPDPASVFDHLYSSAIDPVSPEFESPARPQGEPTTMVDLLNSCMRDEMARDERIVVFGEDVADAADEKLEQVKGKGGVFKVTWGLQKKFGSRRVFNSPLAEANIIGRAVGMATRGLKPVVEIQFFDYIWPAFMQIRSELALMRWRSNGAFACPVVVRVPIGGYLGGGSIYHSQSGEVLFTHMPGLRVVMPATAADANGLLRTAIRCDDPVIFLEHKHLYRQTYNKEPYPGPDFMIPFGKAKTVLAGNDITLITYGALVERSARAAKKAAELHGVSVEVIDLRSLAPFDWQAIEASVKRTGRALVVHEDVLSFGYGAEIAARIGGELFEYLDAPVRRVAAKDTWVAYEPGLEDAVLPQEHDVLAAIEALARY
ncbi:MAG TPA: thiamine pyrophosphate-dependent enzyme [Candidatus Polarisedimenticolia bacterium]|jgi:2-oxoisovalerate dehydrogenase E1 component